MTRTLRLGVAVTGLAATGLVAAVVTPLGCGPAKNTQTTTKSQKVAEDPWPKLVAAMRSETDPQACRQLLAELNSGLIANESADRPQAPSSEEVSAVVVALRLTDQEKKDFAQLEFTPLDGNYVAECLYLRDAARSLGVAPTDPATRRAAVAFQWACRQIVLNPWAVTDQQAVTIQPPLPPEHVLRRGSGSGFERALVFLALCRQLDVDAYLIGRNAADRTWAHMWPGKGKEAPKGPFWAVGVRDGADILLYDPWRGEAMPGKAADKPATLNDAKADPKTLLAWLAQDPSSAVVTEEDLSASELYLSAPLSAFSPRMATLGKYLKADIGVKTAVAWREAVKSAESAAGGRRVSWWNPPTDPFSPGRVLGRFLPVNQGGFDDMPEGQSLFSRYRISLIPAASLLTTLPDVKYPDTTDRLRAIAVSAYTLAFATKPSPREKIQRGKHFEATQQLVKSRDDFKDDRLTAGGGGEVVPKWVEEANGLYDALSRARVSPNKSFEVPAKERDIEDFWKRSQNAVVRILADLIGKPAVAEATYLIALSFHERAEAAELQAGRAAGADAKAAAEGWRRASEWWQQYAEYQALQDRSFPGRAAHTKKLADRARIRTEAK